MNGMDYTSLLESYGVTDIISSYGLTDTDLILAGILMFLLILISLVIGFRSRYTRIGKAVRGCSNELKKHQKLIDIFSAKIKKYESTGSAEELEHWSVIEDELSALADLPSIEETEEEIILRTHIAQSRKDYVDVSATNESVIISIKDEEGIPVNVIYGIPAAINPGKLIVTYKGNTLEIHAPKELLKAEEKKE